MTSMTGYGKHCLDENGRQITVEIKSVNNRYLDINCKLPRALLSLEEVVRKAVSREVLRGRVDVFATYNDNRVSERKVNVDLNLAKGYVNAARLIADETGTANDLSVSALLKLPDIAKADTAEDDLDEVSSLVARCTEIAASNLNKMRAAEGAFLKADITEKTKTLLALTKRIEERAPVAVADYRQKLTARITEAMAGVEYDEARLLTEVAFFTDKSNIDEEISRLYSHYEQLSRILQSAEPVGRKLDFLVQELNREINTVCSKSGDIEITSCGLELKSEIEKIREQVQNLE